MNIDLQSARLEIEKKFEYMKWSSKIPYISFPPEWKIQIVPPFGGAIARFRVRKDNADISVYLDCYDALGHMGGPYWEIYPYTDEDSTYRCNMNDTDNLLEAITLAVKISNDL